MKNKKIKKIILKISSFIMIIVLAVTGIILIKKNKEKKDLKFSETLESVSKDTYLDDYLSSKKPTLLDEITLLEEYINLSNEMDKKKYPKIYITKEQLNEGVLLEPTEINNLLEKYKSNKTEENLFEINLQNKLINKYIMDNGYRISSQLTLYTTKVKIAESYGFDKKITFDIIDSIVIPTQKEFEKTDQETLKIGKATIGINSNIRNLINQTHSLQTLIGEEIEEEYKERNEEIEESIDFVEKSIPKKYTLKIK